MRIIETVTRDEAEKTLAVYGLTLLMWVSCHVKNNRAIATICDYRQLPEYAHAFQVAVYDCASGVTVERFNIAA